MNGYFPTHYRYKNNLSKEEFEKKKANISKLLDKYDGKFDKLINAMNRKYASNASAPKSEKEEVTEKEETPASQVSDGTHSGFAETNKQARKAAIAKDKAKKKAAIAKAKEMKKAAIAKAKANKKLAMAEAKDIKNKHEAELKLAKSEAEIKQKAAKAELGKKVKAAKLKKQGEDKVKNKVASETAKVQQQSKSHQQ